MTNVGYSAGGMLIVIFSDVDESVGAVDFEQLMKSTVIRIKVTGCFMRAKTPNEKGERCGGENRKTSAAKSPDDNPQPLAEACRSAAFARPTVRHRYHLQFMLPRTKTWDEASDVPAILSIGIAKPLLQLRLLDEWNVEKVQN